MRRIIRERRTTAPQLRASARWAQAALDSLTNNAASIHGKLSRMLRGELDWIVMKAWKRTARGATNRPAPWRPMFSATWTTKPVAGLPAFAGVSIGQNSWPSPQPSHHGGFVGVGDLDI